MITRFISKFIAKEVASGLVLLVAAVTALLLANSMIAPLYFHVLDYKITLGAFGYELTKTAVKWINDGLMALFFLLVGLEIKREFLEGELKTREQAMLPALAALGGIVVPMLVYLAVNYNYPENARGWAIPAATDIAFALGVLALLGSRVPLSLKVFLTALAILDDMAAVIIIGLFYTESLALQPLALAAGFYGLLLLFNRAGITWLWVYLFIGLGFWLAVVQTGLHGTIAGVLLALIIPFKNKTAVVDHELLRHESPLKRLEHLLHPWVAFGLLPIFALANAGVPLGGITWQSLLHPITLGIILGLFVGKQLGIFAMVWLAVKLGWCAMPRHASWGQIYGVAVLAGIGFTMSLFIAGLAFADPALQVETRVGVLAGSVLSAVLGYVVLRCSAKPNIR